MNIFRITSRIQREDELAHIRLGFFFHFLEWYLLLLPFFNWWCCTSTEKVNLICIIITDTYLFFSFSIFFFTFFFSISKHPFIALVFSFRFVWHVIRFCGGETAAVEKKEPFEDASKKILLIVRKTESVHDLLKRWYLAKESEKTRRSSNGPSSEMGKKLLTDPTY